MKKTKSVLLGTTAYYAPPTDQAAAAPEASQPTAERPAYTPENERLPSAVARKGRPQRARAPPNDNDAGASAMSITRFCRRNDISEPMYFKLQANGLGPKT